MVATDFAIRLRVADPGGALVHSEDVREWGPAYEDLLFGAVLDGRLPNDGVSPRAALDPVRTGDQVRAFRLSIEGASKEYPLAILSDRVWQIVTQFRLAARPDEEAANAGDYTWDVLASAKEPPQRPRSLRMKREPYPLLEAPPAAAAAVAGEGTRLAICGTLAAQLNRMAAESWDCERASLLAGWLVRAGNGAVVVADRAYPVDSGVAATQASIDFSPESFHRAMRELVRGGEGRVPVGWAHNHPPPCGRRCPDPPPPCDAGSVFFSVDDRVVHRTYFAAPYMIAVVSGKGPGRRIDDPLQKAYGWRDGMIGEIAFSTYEEQEP